MYERDVARNGVLVGGQTAGYHDGEALRKMAADEMSLRAQALGNRPVQSALSKPAEPEQPLLSEMYDRLQRVSNNLAEAICRVEAVTDRVLGPVPIHPDSATGGTSPSKPPAAEVLTGLICGIALQVERLHEVASRVERIG